MVSLFADAEEDLDAIAEAENAADAEAGDDAEEITPRNNPVLLGHEDAENQILKDYNAGRTPHALILAGPVGIGKATLAYRIARFLLAQGQDEGDSLFGAPEQPATLYVAPENPVFRRIASGGHADLLTVEREFDEKKGRYKQEISVDAVRRIHPFLRKTAAEGGWRVVIVDSAEHLNHASQNALLKILEEPPKKTVLILTTSQPGAFLPTIRSRCRLLRLSPLPENVLMQLVEKFSPGLGSEQKGVLTRFCDGSIGRALDFAQNDGVTQYKNLLKVVATLPELDMVAVHDIADKAGRFGAERSFETLREILLTWTERLARLEARGLPVTDIMTGDSDHFRRLMEVYPPRHFLQAWEKMAQMFRQAEWSNLDRRQALISAFLILQKPDYNIPSL